MNDEIPVRSGPSGFAIAVTIVGIIALAFAVLLGVMVSPSVSPLISKPFPEIEAGGWINGPGPTSAELHGQVVVVDVWAFWCEPCQIAAAQLVPVYKKYKDRGVHFIGLTSEGRDSKTIELSRQFVTSLKLTWPNGYAATKILSELDVHEIPQLFVIDRQNRIVFHELGFSSNSIHELEQALDKALASR